MLGVATATAAGWIYGWERADRDGRWIFVVSTDEHIVVGVSDSANSAAALRWAAAEARLRGAAEIWAVHAWSSRWETLAPYAPLRGVPSPDQQQQESRALLTAAIGHALGSGSTRSGVSVRPVLVEGHPVSVLLRHAAGARLLVLGRRLRPGHLDGSTLGVVPRIYIAHAQCPVVVVAATEIADDAETSATSQWHLCVGR